MSSMSFEELTEEQIRDLLTKPKKTGSGSSPTRPAPSRPVTGKPLCDHDWIPHTLIVTGLTRTEWPTKKCVTCNVWMLCAPGEVLEEETKDIAEWLA